jgi:hypothetical protein
LGGLEGAIVASRFSEGAHDFAGLSTLNVQSPFALALPRIQRHRMNAQANGYQGNKKLIKRNLKATNCHVA